MANHSTTMTYGNGEMIPESISHGLEDVIPVDSSSRILASSESEFQLGQNDSTSLKQKEVVSPVLEKVGTEKTLSENKVSSTLKVTEPLQQNGLSSSSNKTALVTPEDEPTGTTNPIKALVYPDERKWTTKIPGSDTTLIKYSFMFGEDTDPNDNFDTVAMNVEQRQQTIAALEEWEDLAKIDFQFDPTGNGQIFFGTADLIKFHDDDPVGFAPGNVGDSVAVWLDNNYSSSDNPTNQNPIPGTDGFDTLIHEIGHALGLKHPGNYGSDDKPPFLSGGLDDKLYTVMSRNVDQLTNQINHSLTPMVLDVAAIQYLYGANDISRSGNNTYSWSSSAKHFAATIWDNGGIDSISVSDNGLNSKIDLGETNGDSGPGIPIDPDFGLPITRSQIGISDLIIPNGVIIENVSGGSKNDTISGNAVDNTFLGFDGDDELNGRGGNDSLFGHLGNDTLDGGVGDDLLHGELNDDTYIVDSPGDVVVEDLGGVDPGGSDEVQSSISYTLGDRIENLTLIGEAFADGTGNNLGNLLVGNNAGNFLDGGVGEDTIRGVLGEDILSGGANNDYLAGDNDNNFNENPTIDILSGGTGDDSLFGEAGDDILLGDANNDRLQGDSGSDYLEGGSGDDIYIADEFDKIVELVDGGNDIIRSDSITILPDNVEKLEPLNPQATTTINFTGNILSNEITGNAGNNVLSGLAGDDTLNGLEGSDTLNGGDNNDLLNSGRGNDFVDGGAGIDQITASGDFFGLDLRDTFLKLYESSAQLVKTDSPIDVENLFNANSTQLVDTDTLANTETASLTGGEGSNHLYAYFYTQGSVSLFGLGGNDSLNGGTGSDTLEGGSGDDALTGDPKAGDAGNNSLTGAGNDYLNGGTGKDRIGGGAGNDVLVGGDAALDTFIFAGNAPFTRPSKAVIVDPALGVDRIEDFDNADYIEIDKTVFSTLKSQGGIGSPVFGFSEASEFAVVSNDVEVAASRGLIVYSKATGNLFYNQNSTAADLGSGGLFATLVNSPELTVGDFIITV